MGLPQVQLPGFWLMVPQSQVGPQAQANFATVLKGRGFSHPVPWTMATSFSILTILPLTMGFLQTQAPSLRDMVLQSQLSPQLQT